MTTDTPTRTYTEKVVRYLPGGPTFRQALDRASKPYIYKSTTTGLWTVIYGDRPTRRFSSWTDAITSATTRP